MKKDADDLFLAIHTPLEILDYYKKDILSKCKMQKWISMNKVEQFLKEKNIQISRQTIQYWANLRGIKIIYRRFQI